MQHSRHGDEQDEQDDGDRLDRSARDQWERDQRKVDEASEDSFPASDPPAHSVVLGVGSPCPNAVVPGEQDTEEPAQG